MTSIFNDPELWRERAQEARGIADDTDNPIIRRSMLKIAQEYDALAQRAPNWNSDPTPSRK